MASVYPDLVDSATVTAQLAERGLTPAELAAVPQLVTSTSANMRLFLRRVVSAWTFDELYTLSAPDRDLNLRQFPVLGVESVRSGLSSVLNVTNSVAQRAVVTLQSSGDPETGPAPTGLTLVSWTSGVKASQSVTFAANPTLSAVASAITGLGGGWSATADPTYALFPSVDLRAVQGSSAAGGKTAQLVMHTSDVDFTVDERTGTVSLGTMPNGSTNSPRWGPSWSQEFDDVSIYGGTNGVRIVYTAGWRNVPADITQGVVEVVKAALDRMRTDSAVISESDGTISWSGRSAAELTVIPLAVQRALSQRVNYTG